ncbi:hypothetical protein ACFL5U_01845 [Candidatus Margulisiibacteriota bacterium]
MVEAANFRAARLSRSTRAKLAAYGAVTTVGRRIRSYTASERGRFPDDATTTQRLAYFPPPLLSPEEILEYNFSEYSPEYADQRYRNGIDLKQFRYEEIAGAKKLYQAGAVQTFFRESDVLGMIGEGMSTRFMYFIGRAHGTLLREKGVQDAVVAYDLRTYSRRFTEAAIAGLRDSGVNVHYIKLATTSMAFFAQFLLDVKGLLMVTAGFRVNGWSGVRLGYSLAETLGDEGCRNIERRFRAGQFIRAPRSQRGKLVVYSNRSIREQYLDDVCRKIYLPGMKVVVDTAHGTAGMVVGRAFRRVGAEVIEQHTKLDTSFPDGPPDIELPDMRKRLQEAVNHHQADIGFGFSGNGGALGVVSREGPIEPEQVATLVARRIVEEAAPEGDRFLVVDFKSSHSVETDPVLREHGVKVVYWKTGHSPIKLLRKMLGAIFASEKSGKHFPRRGYDEALRTALGLAQYCRDKGQRIGQAVETLAQYCMGPHTRVSMAQHLLPADKTAKERKHEVVAAIQALLKQKIGETVTLDAREFVIAEVLTTEGVRVFLKTVYGKEGPNFIIRASINNDDLTINIETPGTETLDNKRLVYAVQECIREDVLDSFEEYGAEAAWQYPMPRQRGSSATIRT